MLIKTAIRVGPLSVGSCLQPQLILRPWNASCRMIIIIIIISIIIIIIILGVLAGTEAATAGGAS